MSHDTKELYCAPSPPPSPLPFCREVEPQTKFSKMGDFTGPQLLDGEDWERGR